MAAIAYPSFAEVVEDDWRAARTERPPLQLVVPPPPLTRRRPAARPYRRRRVAVLMLVLGLFLLVVATLQWVGASPLSSDGLASNAPRPRVTHVVQPGETLWGIARALDPTGDVRPLVAYLATQLHGLPLQEGQVLALR